MSQETINYETKINDLKKAMKEILTTPTNVLWDYQINVLCDALGSMSPTLEEIFTRYNISKINFANYVKCIFMYIGRILEAQGKDFNLNSSTIDLISENNLLQPIIEFFISNVFDINDPNEISNIQQQIILELNQQKFESQDSSKQKILDAPSFADVNVMQKVFAQNYLHDTSWDEKTRSSIFNAIYEIFGHNISENSNSSLFTTTNDLFDSTPEPKEADLEIENLNSFNKNEPNRNQAIEQQIKQVELTQDRNELSTLIKMLNDMRDKLSEVFSPQAIKNVINFLEDILKNNNDNEINSVCNIIHEFDEISSISVVPFLNNFFKHYPVFMNENFDFEKLVDFIDNKLFKESINCLNFALFDDLKEAIKWEFSLSQYKYLVKNFLSEIEKISNKTIEEILEPSEPYKFEFVYVTQILNQNDLKELKNKLIIPGKDYPMERTQDDLNSEKIVKLDDELWNLKNQDKILSSKEYSCISKYCEHMVGNSETEKINFCSLISNSPNGIDRTLVDSLLDLASLFQLKRIFFHIPLGLVKDFITFWALNYDMNRIFLNKIEVSSKFQPILNLAEALKNSAFKICNYFSDEQINNFINFIGDICEENNIDEMNSIINMIQEFKDINGISSIIHFLHNFLRRYPEARAEEPIPNSEIDKSEIEH